MGGVNDTAGSSQADVTQICYDNSNLPTSYDITLNWDETGISGKNTSDGCALFDTDGDALGLIDYAICVQLGDNPYELELGSPYAYQCNTPNSQVACGGEVLLSLSAGTTCSVTSPVSDDPFIGGSSYPNDGKVTCTISTSDIPAGGLQINFCSYTSASPTSAPKDCVQSIGGAQIFLLKDASPDDSTNFAFNTTSLGGFSQNDVIVGDGGTIIDVTPGVYSIAETVPTNWGLTSLSCVDRDNNAIGTVNLTSGAVTGLTMGVADRTTCTFTNRQQADLEIAKSDASVSYTPGQTSTYLITVTNKGPAGLSGAQVTDSIPAGLTIDSVSCNIGASCSINQVGQDVTVTMDIANQEIVTISVQVTYSDNPSSY